jgi:TolA-binding protein
MKKFFAVLLITAFFASFAACVSAADVFPPVEPGDTAEYQFVATTMGGFVGMGGSRTMQLDSRGTPLTETPDEAWLTPPAALKMGELPLIRPAKPQATSVDPAYGHEDWTMKIYWGSSKTVQQGQPIVISTKDAMKNSGKLFNFQPAADIWRGAPKQGWGWGQWPNAESSESVPNNGSLKGEHFVHGNYLPHIKFNVDSHDFLPAITARSSGGGAEPAAVDWDDVPGTVGYFAYAMAVDDAAREMTIWTSSTKATSGIQGHEHSARIKELINKGVVLPTTTRAVDIPAGIFEGRQNPILMVHAWGDDFSASYPPKPTKPPKNWKPDWRVSGLFLTTWTGMLGMEMPTPGYTGGTGSDNRDSGGERVDSGDDGGEISVGVPIFGSIKIKPGKKQEAPKEEPKAEEKPAPRKRTTPAPKPESVADEPAQPELAPVSDPEPVPTPEQAQPEPALAPAAKTAAELGFDPNTTTDAKVINSYPLSSKEKNMLGIQQRNAYNLYSKKQYQKALEAFSKLADDYPDMNYLSAYWAGMSSLKIKNGKTAAKEWFDKALAINPDYKPAEAERAKIK